MAAHNELGKWGEDLATAYLEQKGYTIVERDWKSGRRDIDIIAIELWSAIGSQDGVISTSLPATATSWCSWK